MSDGLSTNAIRLLNVLRSVQGAGEHLPDHRLSDWCNLPIREIIDVADELLRAGYPVCADGRGRFLGDVFDLNLYIASLRKRARKIFVRCGHAIVARDALERAAGNLFEQGGSP
jgi:hypothetical protein